MARFGLAGVTLTLSDGWRDITDDLASDAPPTLARADGVGAMQFSVGRYVRGMSPVVTENDLRRMFADFCVSHSLFHVEPLSFVPREGLGVGGVAATPQELIAVWYVTNGTDVVLMTYTSLEPASVATKNELSNAREMVESVEFGRLDR